MRNEPMRRSRPEQSWPGYDQRDDGWSDNRSERWAQDDWQAESDASDWESRWRRESLTPGQLSEGGPPRGGFGDDDRYGTQRGRPYGGGYAGEDGGRQQYGQQRGQQRGRGAGYGGGYGREYGSEYGSEYGGEYAGQPSAGQSGGRQYGQRYGSDERRGDWPERSTRAYSGNEYRTDPWQSGRSGAAELEASTGPEAARRGQGWRDEDERYGANTWRGGQRQAVRNRDQDWLREAERSTGYSSYGGDASYGWDRFDDDWPGRNYAVPEHSYGGGYREDRGGRGTDYGRHEGYGREDRERGEEHGPLYNIGRRIGEAVSEFFGTDERPQRRVGPKGYRRSDDRIREAVCERLAYADGLDVSEVTVDVNGGIVKLGGTVRDRKEKYDIEDLVDNIFGVTDVENDIHVRRESGQSPARMDDLKGWSPD